MSGMVKVEVGKTTVKVSCKDVDRMRIGFPAYLDKDGSVIPRGDAFVGIITSIIDPDNVEVCIQSQGPGHVCGRCGTQLWANSDHPSASCDEEMARAIMEE